MLNLKNIFFAVKSSTLKTFASSNGLSFLPPNNRPMSNEDLGQLITEATVFLECWMTVAKIKQIIAQEFEDATRLKQIKDAKPEVSIAT